MTKNNSLHVMCYSGGVESAVAVIELVRRYGNDNVVLLNHDISPDAEDQDIKQYKQDIADYLGLPITPCNAVSKSYSSLDPILGAIERNNFKSPMGHLCCHYLNTEPFNLWLDPIIRAMETKAFKVGCGSELCTARLKTEPFDKWLSDRSDKSDISDMTVYYGFAPEEQHRVSRRQMILGKRGIKSDYPLLWADRTIHDTAEIGIPAPAHYKIWKHGNCIGCLKAGWQHWYCVYVHRRDRWELSKIAEGIIGYAINKRGGVPCRLIEREAEFEELRQAGLPATEHIPAGKFWSTARKLLKNT